MLSANLNHSLEKSLNAKVVKECNGVLLLESPLSDYVAFHFFKSNGDTIFLYCDKTNERQFQAISEHHGLHRIAAEAYCVSEVGKMPQEWFTGKIDIIHPSRGRRIIIRTPSGDPVLML